MLNAMLGEKRLEMVGYEFSTPIGLQLFDRRRKLVLNKNFELDKTFIDIRFGMKRVEPNIPREVIHKDHIIFVSTN
jgi:hypothetical protein